MEQDVDATNAQRAESFFSVHFSEAVIRLFHEGLRADIKNRLAGIAINTVTWADYLQAAQNAEDLLVGNLTADPLQGIAATAAASAFMQNLDLNAPAPRFPIPEGAVQALGQPANAAFNYGQPQQNQQQRGRGRGRG